MPTHLLEGPFQLPAHHKPTEDLMRIGLKVGTQQCLSFELSFRIMDQNPAHGHGERARGVPHGRLGRDFDHTLPAPIPVSDLDGLPNGVRLFAHHRKVGQPLALYARSPSLMGASWRSRFIKGSIQAQAADEGDRISQAPAALEQFERCISAIGYGHDLTLWVPPPYDQEQLP